MLSTAFMTVTVLWMSQVLWDKEATAPREAWGGDDPRAEQVGWAYGELEGFHGGEQAWV